MIGRLSSEQRGERGVKVRCKKCGERLVYRGDEYGSLAQGGSYEIYECENGHRVYSQMPD